MSVIVGRTVQSMRLFVSCLSGLDHDLILIFDHTKDGFVLKENDSTVQIMKGTQPYIADFNGDFLTDILYTDANEKQLKVNFYTKT